MDQDIDRRILKFFSDGSEFGVSITYKAQKGPDGIADALLKAEDFFKNQKAVAICGDTFFDKITVPPNAFNDDFAYIFIQERKQPWGSVPEFDKEGNVINIEETPKSPKSNYVVEGLFIYPNDVFDHIRTQKPSKRGELEITDVNNWYLKQKRLKAVKIDSYVLDMGTFDTLLKATILRAKKLGHNVNY